MFRGTYTALVTPFQDGEVDLPALAKLIEGQIAGGITGLVAVGTTGESTTLSHDEREQIIRLTVEMSKGRGQGLAGIGAPYCNKPDQEGLFRHFQAIAQSTKSPLMLYNIPGRCAVDIGPETVERLAMDCANIVTIKEAGGSVDRVSELRGRLPEALT